MNDNLCVGGMTAVVYIVPVKQDEQSKACGPKQVLQEESQEWHSPLLSVSTYSIVNIDEISKIR
jgi:hypothetical protein